MHHRAHHLGGVLHPLPGGWKYATGLVFIWGGALAVVQSVRIGKWVPIAGAITRIVLLGFFLVSVVVFAAENGVHALPAGEFAPTYVGFVALVPVLIFNFVGFELPSSAAEEMKNPRRDIPLSILRSGLASLVLYGGPILGILFVLPSQDIGSLGGFIDACKAVFTVYAGSIAADGTVTLTGAGSVFGGIAAAGLIIGLLTSGVTWAMGAHRAQAVACADGAGPAWLGAISERHGTPVRVNLLSAVPGGRAGAWLVTALATGFVAFTVVVLIWPGFGVGWFGTDGVAADSLPESFAGERLQYTLSQVVPLVLFLVIGLIFYALGAKTRRSKG